MLATISQLSSYLNVQDDDDRLGALLVEAEAALGDKWGLPKVGAITATKHYTVDGETLFVRDCAEVTSITDSDGNALLFVEAPGEDAADALRWVTLESPYKGVVAVTGTFGITRVPYAVSRAIVVTAGAWYRRQTTGAEGNYIGNLSAIPKEADDLMRSWRGWTL